MKLAPLVLAGIALTILCWGIYAPVLHKGQEGLGGNRLKPLICVGAAYFVVAIIIPVVLLIRGSSLSGDWSFFGIFWSMMAGTAGAVGALGIIVALTSGGKPYYVMPLVFGCAPVVNAFLTIYLANTWKEVGPVFYAGLILVAVGAVTVLLTTPSPKKPPHSTSPTVERTEEAKSDTGKTAESST